MDEGLPTIENIKELIDGRTYYVRLPSGTQKDKLERLADNILSLNLKCNIIFGAGEFDIVDISDQIKPKGL